MACTIITTIYDCCLLLTVYPRVCVCRSTAAVKDCFDQKRPSSSTSVQYRVGVFVCEEECSIWVYSIIERSINGCDTDPAAAITLCGPRSSMRVPCVCATSKRSTCSIYCGLQRNSGSTKTNITKQIC